MADNLESYFKKHLSKDTPGEDKWNVPSDDVWEKVLPEISKKKGLFIPWKYLYILAFIVLAGLAFILWPTGQTDISLIENETESLAEKNISQYPQNTSNATYNNPDKSDTDGLGYDSQSDPSGVIADNASTSNAKSTQSTEANISQVENSIPHSTGFDTNQKKPSQTTLFNKTSLKKRPQIEIAVLSSETIDFSSLNNETLLPRKDTIALPLPAEMEKNKPEPFDNKGKFGIGLFFKPTFTSTSLRGEMNTGFMETGNMYLYVSNWGFEARYHLSNRFILVAGVEKSEIRSWSKSVVDFGYDTSTEHLMGNGKKENTSPVPMPTPFGEINTEITYRFPATEEIPDGELMNSILETHQEVRYLSIPLGLEYNLMRFSHVNWFAETGIAYNRALRDGTSFSSRILHKGHDMDVVGETMTSYPSYTLNYLNFYLGTGVSYQFSKALQVNGSVRYFGNITKVNLQDNLSTYVHGFNLKIGIIYIF
ncbi:MAG: hypothetical protein V2I62_03875 [Bacteroidales bacterium]|jgi:hypothetical protein|nr:hypothetical protein [Bacteroidales bacterium]